MFPELKVQLSSTAAFFDIQNNLKLLSFERLPGILNCPPHRDFCSKVI